MWWMYAWAAWAEAMLAPYASDQRTEEYLVSELREDLELMGVEGIIDEGGRE